MGWVVLPVFLFSLFALHRFKSRWWGVGLGLGGILRTCWFRFIWGSWAVGLLLAGSLLLAGCGVSGPDKEPASLLRVAVAIEPVAFLVERLAGPYAQVLVLIPAGADAHTFQLSPRQMADLVQADLFVRVGLALEDRILQQVRQTRPDLPVVDLAQGIARRRFLPEEGHNHSDSVGSLHEHNHSGHPEQSNQNHSAGQANGQEGRPHPEGPMPPHSEGESADLVHAEGESAGLDPHIWLSPPLLKQQAHRIAHALCQKDPRHSEHYRRNLAQLEAELDRLDSWIRQQLAPYQGRTFFVFHPSFGYFADCYGLRQMAVQVEGKTPTPQELRRLIQQAQSEQAPVILVQPQFDRRAAQVVAEAIGARLVEINDLDRNVLDTLKKLTQTLAKAFAAGQSIQPKSVHSNGTRQPSEGQSPLPSVIGIYTSWSSRDQRLRERANPEPPSPLPSVGEAGLGKAEAG